MRQPENWNQYAGNREEQLRKKYDDEEQEKEEEREEHFLREFYKNLLRNSRKYTTK